MRASRPIVTSASICVDRGIHDRHARKHVAVVDLRLGQLAHPRQRREIVDAEHEPHLLDNPGRDREPLGAQLRERLREVQLALGVVGLQARQDRRQGLRVEGVDAGVHLTDLELGGRGVLAVLRLDDPFHEAGRVAHDAPVARRVLEHRGDHRGGRPALGMGVARAARSRRH